MLDDLMLWQYLLQPSSTTFIVTSHANGVQPPDPASQGRVDSATRPVPGQGSRSSRSDLQVSSPSCGYPNQAGKRPSQGARPYFIRPGAPTCWDDVL